MELKCCVQKYNWGKKGSSSTVAHLASANNGEIIDASTSYAELWMGVHPSGPSIISSGETLLSDYLLQNPTALGNKMRSVFSDNLPFLFKVLSVDKALSIQAHPSKIHAEQLHDKYPDLYKDPNHKPELAVALTKFEALCGFRPRREIETFLKTVPELAILLGKEKVNNFINGKDGIRNCFEGLMTSNSIEVKDALNSLIASEDISNEIQLIRRLSSQYPGDVGALCVFWLNYIILKPGEALFLSPNEPHAYLSGDCIECMANSDNVVRAGLTPKFRDVPTLCDMLTYKSHEPNEIRFLPEVEDEHTLMFRPPVEDFAVAKISVNAGISYDLKTRENASIILVIGGEATAKISGIEITLKPGTVLFVPAGETISLSTLRDLLLFQALCNV